MGWNSERVVEVFDARAEGTKQTRMGKLHGELRGVYFCLSYILYSMIFSTKYLHPLDYRRSSHGVVYPFKILDKYC